MYRKINSLLNKLGSGLSKNKLIEITMEQKITLVIQLIESCDFIQAYDIALSLYEEYKESNKLLVLFNLASLMVDIGQMGQNNEASKLALEIFEKNKDQFLSLEELPKNVFYYNLGNAKSNFINDREKLNISNNLSFYDIENLVALKNYYWKAIKYAKEEQESVPSEYIVNLGTSLKRQFRLVEALSYYDQVNKLDVDIPQSWQNRSETLELLNQISDTYTISMLYEIKRGYDYCVSSNTIPEQWKEGYKHYSNNIQSSINAEIKEKNINIDKYEENHLEIEYSQLSKYRKFYLDEHLSLSEHGLYCKCNGSNSDNLTICTDITIVGEHIIPMEFVLNRLKSEFIFARYLYYEFLYDDDNEFINKESCFLELHNDDILSLDIEKIRTSFRVCFGVLDKIGVAICDLYNLYPKNKIVYFQNFWQLDQNQRRQKFEEIKTPGLLALYSIATDLNDRKDGELSFFKEWRNDLEHKFVVVHKNETIIDDYSTYPFFNNILFIQESELIENLKTLLQLTRSAIFSFVFMIREDASKNNKKDMTIIQKIEKKS